jgi:uncharacterized Zn finger protein
MYIFVTKIKICPVCGSTRIHYVAGMVTGEKYKCENCGYVGSLILEIEEEDYETWVKELRGDKNGSGDKI